MGSQVLPFLKAVLQCVLTLQSLQSQKLGVIRPVEACSCRYYEFVTFSMQTIFVACCNVYKLAD